MLQSDEPPLLAVKRLHSTRKEDFEKEVEMLKVISAHQHPHLIQLLATYRHKQKYHLIFPMAQGDLRSYWNLPENPPADEDTISWMLKQLRGITDGLSSIHNHDLALDLKNNFPASMNDWDRRFGRHGDIKPENILWTNEGFDKDHGPSINSQLVITDFGLMELQTAASRSRVDPRSIGGSPTYEPPERSLNLPVSRAYDIWVWDAYTSSSSPGC
jgi:serine/threonine protein kinase